MLKHKNLAIIVGLLLPFSPSLFAVGDPCLSAVQTLSDTLVQPLMNFENAKLLAVMNPENLGLNMGKYKLTDNQWDIVSEIACTNISDQSLKKPFGVAKLEAIKTPDRIAKLIASFEFPEDQRFEIAKVIAHHEYKKWRYLEPIRFFETLPKFQLSKEHRFEVAKISASRDPDFSNHIALFELDEKQRFEVAKIATQLSQDGVSSKIRSYNLNQKERF
ncbi:MAG: hypothetical protein JWQ35_2716, partial [Bacteriovoracaceae bacterium]|nr:hypothetical protein [Bacteriovoracaceae bacterium]